MRMESYEKIMSQLSGYIFPKEIEPVIELLKKYKNRVHFVKDHHGLRNILFIATAEAANEFFESPYFSMYENQGNKAQGNAAFAPEEIYRSTQYFLENTSKPIYVGIGFTECEVNYEDNFNIFYLLEETKCDVNEAYLTFRRFPEWYMDEADYPIHIIQEEKLLQSMTETEKRFLIKKKETLFEELNSVVEENNEFRFEELTNEYNRINKQISESNNFLK